MQGCPSHAAERRFSLRIAAIDIGSNSIHMVIAAAHGASGFEVVDREREVVQIGRGSFDSRRLNRDAMKRTALALRRFAQLARRMRADRIVCTATAAVREARNGGEFLQLCRAAAGVTPRVIPASEEGRLIDLAVRSALQLPERGTLVVDIGGGSAQVVMAREGGSPRVASAPLGALRLTEQYLADDPPTARQVSRLRREIRERVEEAFSRLGAGSFERVYGSSGSIHALAHAAYGLDSGNRLRQVNGHVLSAGSLRKLTRKLVRMPRAQRERLPEVDPWRAEIILPGALVLLEILERSGAEAITLCDFGLREGLVLDWLSHHRRELSSIEEVGDLRLRSVLSLLAKFGPEGPHAPHVAELSLALFDGLASRHELGSEARELLRFAALLHDVGSAIGYDGHARHSQYVIEHGNLRGLTDEEVQVIALVACYHGKARPRKRDEAFARQPRRVRRLVRWLAAMLRVAEGLDRSHYQLIRGLRVVSRGDAISIVAAAQHDAQLELWGARQRVRELERLTGARVRVTLAARADRPAASKEGTAIPVRRALRVVRGIAATPAVSSERRAGR